MRRLPIRQVDASAIPDGPLAVTAGEVVAGQGGASGLPPGGTTGQVLKKASDADGDVAWQEDLQGSGGAGAAAVGCDIAYQGANQASASGTRTVTMDTAVRVDAGFSVDLASGTITAEVAGWYSLHGHVRISGFATGNHSVWVETTAGVALVLGTQINTSQYEFLVAGVAYLDAGTSFRLRYFSANAQSIVGGTATSPSTTLRAVRM